MSKWGGSQEARLAVNWIVTNEHNETDSDDKCKKKKKKNDEENEDEDNETRKIIEWQMQGNSTYT